MILFRVFFKFQSKLSILTLTECRRVTSLFSKNTDTCHSRCSQVSLPALSPCHCRYMAGILPKRRKPKTITCDQLIYCYATVFLLKLNVKRWGGFLPYGSTKIKPTNISKIKLRSISN